MDKALKQRLVGASVLIALAVVVLPMLLSGQPGDQQEARSIEVPPRPTELSFETRRFPLGEQQGEPSVVEPTVVQHDTLVAEPEVPDQGPASGVVTQRAVKPETAVVDQGGSQNTRQAAEPEAVLPGRYLVQVASFSTAANANRLAERLREDDMRVLMDTIEASVGRLHRVRVGPFDAVSGAQQAMAEIRARTPDVNPRIIDLRPDESAPVTDPEDPLARWIVQVGSFSEPGNAEGLVERMRAAGFKAYQVAVTSAGVQRFKVRVGPEIDRESAVLVAADIRSKLNLDGIVMTSE
jgi:cell division septation protein DedD